MLAALRLWWLWRRPWLWRPWRRRASPEPLEVMEARLQEVVSCLEVRTRELSELVELGRGLTARAAWSEQHRRGGS